MKQQAGRVRPGEGPSRGGSVWAGALLTGVAFIGCGASAADRSESSAGVGADDAPVTTPGALGPSIPGAPSLPGSAGEVGAGFGGGELLPSPEAPSRDLSAAESCAASSVAATRVERTIEVVVEEEVVVPSVFYLMLDRSGSMQEDDFSLARLVDDLLGLFGLSTGVQVPPTKWDYAVSALDEFVNDPSSVGMELALQYFPEGGACDGTGYDQPSVPVGVLPEHAPNIVSSLLAQAPAGGTPLEGALRGATRFCLEYNAAHPDRGCVAVLITDGAAVECDARSALALSEIAASAAERGVITYAAGMEGADYAVLDAIAAAGGGDCEPDLPSFACDLTADVDAFTAALSSIRDQARTQTRIERRVEQVTETLPCEWSIPPAPPGEVFDSSRVNVELSGSGEPRQLSAVALASDCGSEGGWYYDDPSAPRSIQACPASCEAIQADVDARVQILFGCQTRIR